MPPHPKGRQDTPSSQRTLRLGGQGEQCWLADTSIPLTHSELVAASLSLTPTPASLGGPEWIGPLLFLLNPILRLAQEQAHDPHRDSEDQQDLVLGSVLEPVRMLTSSLLWDWRERTCDLEEGLGLTSGKWR